MTRTDLQKNAEDCRRQATDYPGKPEAAFLISAATAFKALAKKRNSAGPRSHAKAQ